MEDYKRGSHTMWDCEYHLVWTTKYRYEVLAGMGGSDVASCFGRSRVSGDSDLRRIDQPRPCAHADRDTAVHLSVPGGAVPEREEFAQAVERVCRIAEGVLGPAPVGTRLLGGHQR